MSIHQGNGQVTWLPKGPESHGLFGRYAVAGVQQSLSNPIRKLVDSSRRVKIGVYTPSLFAVVRLSGTLVTSQQGTKP